ncbi:NAD-dependent epimerase/dehydratase family protein [Lutibacter sp. TH_r2]|uniref:NAD-dependent epimerase/dehydratase family protein n=1 Tax=Lutibacter sp. TH_r2 TaxID=3082083 RepID=UPI00295509D0|nr:NAD-dependent epimerase/dehydratase family protein [Lutibacter sp. TH_r2]MDV7187784.1 NAD-dependent epimerase/dehydratase family protein [Lutibacter sp. TH_r2]
MHKKILVTGSTGFVGQNLIPYLEKHHYTSIGVSRTASKQTINYTTLAEHGWDNAFAIIHLAGKAHDLKNSSDDQAYFDVNTELTKNLFQQFLKSDCSIFIYMSSVKAVADTVEGNLKETVKPNPITAYGKSKIAAENYILNHKLPKNKKAYILRPCMIHGPGNKGNLNLLYQIVAKGIPYPLGAFDNKRSFLSVENLCFAIYTLLEKQPESAIFNLADDEAISTTKLIEIIGKASGKNTRIWKLPKSLIHLLASIGSALKLPFNQERLEKLTENYKVDNSLLKNTLTIQLPISTEEGLTTTIQSFQEKK